MLSKYNNYYFKNTGHELCFCHLTLVLPQKSIIRKLIRIDQDFEKHFCPLFNINTCIRNIFYNKIYSKNKPNLIWLEPLAGINHSFVAELSYSLSLRKNNLEFDFKYNLINLQVTLKYIHFLIQETLEFMLKYPTIFDKNLRFDLNSVLYDFFEQKYKLSPIDFSLKLNPILNYNLQFTKQIRYCMSTKGLNELIAFCPLEKKTFSKQQELINSLDLNNNKIIFIPYFSNELYETTFSQNCFHNAKK